MDIEGCTVLDLFSGTGSISYEFASRDASYITAVEMSEKHIAFIRKTCTTLGIDNVRVQRSDVFRFIASTKATYDVIFADPPYQLDRIAEIPDLIFANNLLADDGILRSC